MCRFPQLKAMVWSKCGWKWTVTLSTKIWLWERFLSVLIKSNNYTRALLGLSGSVRCEPQSVLYWENIVYSHSMTLQVLEYWQSTKHCVKIQENESLILIHPCLKPAIALRKVVLWSVRFTAPLCVVALFAIMNFHYQWPQKQNKLFKGSRSDFLYGTNSLKDT